MRALLQRVKSAAVHINDHTVGAIDQGLLILLGIEEADSREDVEGLARKVTGMRIFSDAQGQMNLSVQDVEGELLVVSQFTLHASVKKGNRPSFIKAAKPDVAIPLYEAFVEECRKHRPVQTGEFGADMKVELVNDGPVTIWIDSKNKE
ncbi:MAG: D-tyrosyl-tRNA(Tyr) deacylase [Owenweeksia sp.]|nr:D-tyrosyl-tRNA(Tyr) deacylase [Owenweeksia sp.]